MTIDCFVSTVESLCEKLPNKIFEGLNLGIGISEDVKLHPKTKKHKAPLYIFGEYRYGIHTGCGIMLYYGSFISAYPGISDDLLKIKIEETLKHELMHHLETQAGERKLAIADAMRLKGYCDT